MTSIDTTADSDDASLLEELYVERTSLGTERQLVEHVRPEQITEGFRATVDRFEGSLASGPFYPPASRKPFVDLLSDDTPEPGKLTGTTQLQALLWAPPRWSVEGHPELDFHFLARELTPMSTVKGAAHVWMTPITDHQLTLDALLVNADDRTPIVCEMAVGPDQNAEHGLIQALAAAAQLAVPAQLRRLGVEYRDHLGAEAPTQLDVYVVTADGSGQASAEPFNERAYALADTVAPELAPWIRRIVFLEATYTDGTLRFTRTH
jgi:hypothetical protein